MSLAFTLSKVNIQSIHLNQIQETVFAGISKYGNFVLLGAVGAVLAMMVLPLPSPFLDLLLAINIVGALTILLVAISVTNSMKIAAFPTLLLVATLFRLGLNIASTRLILTQGFAGHIIDTFGRFATGGNLLVGVIMFLILTLIQFIVIAKGSERVAEVAARFTLDALPGKQMSIDADLRAGLITQEEARSQRGNLHRESKMYGSMDGAMKFVKGDAIAGILITFINILGGLATGVMQRGLGFAEAGQTYSILTIGDGLVSQIPALLTSITAGFVVTRVSDEKSIHSLGGDIGIQIFSQPKALLMAAGTALLMGLVPGFPFLLFGLVASVLAGISIYLMKTVKRRVLEPSSIESYVINTEKQMAEHFGNSVPLVLEVGPELYRIFQDDARWTHCFGTLFPKLKLLLSNQLGVAFPDLRLSVSDILKQTFRYRIRIYEVPVDYGILTPRHCSLVGHGDKSSSGEIEGPVLSKVEGPDNITETVHGTRVALWNISQREKLSQSGINTYGPDEMLLRHLARVLKKHAGDFIGIQEVRNLLTIVENNYPELVREVIPKMMSIQKFTEIVKRLVEECVPIKDFRLILQILSCAQPETKDPVTLTEQVRMGLCRTITFMHVHEGNQLPVVTMEPSIEDEVRAAIQKNGSECYLALQPERLQQIAEAFKHIFFENRFLPRQCVVLTHLDIRRYVRKIVEGEFPELSVLSFQELDPKVIIKPLGVVSLENRQSEVIAVNG